jgi:hypothetical protein
MFESILKFLKDQVNIPSIGVGIATIIAAAWAVFTYFDKKSEDKKSQKAPSAPRVTNITADHGSIAAGHIAGSVTINPDAKEVAQQVAAAINERYDRLLAEIARDKRVEVAPLRAVLVKLGEMGVPDEDIPKRLDAAADELIKLRAENELLRRGPPELAAIAEEVQAFIDKGEFDDARRALARGRETARALRIDGSRFEAAFLAQEARVDAPPPRNLPKRPHSSRLSTRSSNGVSCSLRQTNSISKGTNSATMPRCPKRSIAIASASLSCRVWRGRSIGPRPRTISALRFCASASARAGRRRSPRRPMPIARR